MIGRARWGSSALVVSIFSRNGVLMAHFILNACNVPSWIRCNLVPGQHRAAGTDSFHPLRHDMAPWRLLHLPVLVLFFFFFFSRTYECIVRYPAVCSHMVNLRRSLPPSRVEQPTDLAPNPTRNSRARGVRTHAVLATIGSLNTSIYIYVEVCLEKGDFCFFSSLASIRP